MCTLFSPQIGIPKKVSRRAHKRISADPQTNLPRTKKDQSKANLQTGPQPILQGRSSKTRIRRLIQTKGSQHKKVLQNTTTITRRSRKLRGLHDGTHHRCIPRYSNERHQISTQSLRSIRIMHNT